jgi:NADPH2:quinone reductase
MRAVMCRELGEPESLVVEQIPTSPCSPNQVRVHIWASGLNYVDALFVQGKYQIRPQLPFIPGSEIAGEITEIGEQVQGFNVGDRVFASIGLGGFADEAILSPSQIVPIPERLSFAQAATMTQSYATAWYSLTQRTHIQPEEWVVVLGAAGGVGLAMIDVARAHGAKVIAVASTSEKLRLCIERGAHGVIDSSTEDLKTQVRELTGGGADIVVDPVGGSLAESALRALGNNGRYLVIGFASGVIPSLPANQILLRNRQVIGVDWGAWAMANPAENATLLGEVIAAIEEGAITPIEPQSYALAEAGIALRDLLDRRLVGKACLSS